MYQVQLNHLRSRIGTLANSLKERKRLEREDLLELCATNMRLLDFIEELSTKELQK